MVYLRFSLSGGFWLRRNIYPRTSLLPQTIEFDIRYCFSQLPHFYMYVYPVTMSIALLNYRDPNGYGAVMNL